MKPGSKVPKRKTWTVLFVFGLFLSSFFILPFFVSSVSLSQTRITCPRKFELEIDSSSLNLFWRWILSWTKAYCTLIWNWVETSLIQLEERTVFVSFPEENFNLEIGFLLIQVKASLVCFTTQSSKFILLCERLPLNFEF